MRLVPQSQDPLPGGKPRLGVPPYGPRGMRGSNPHDQFGKLRLCH